MFCSARSPPEYLRRTWVSISGCAGWMVARDPQVDATCVSAGRTRALAEGFECLFLFFWFSCFNFTRPAFLSCHFRSIVSKP